MGNSKCAVRKQLMSCFVRFTSKAAVASAYQDWKRLEHKQCDDLNSCETKKDCKTLREACKSGLQDPKELKHYGQSWNRLTITQQYITLLLLRARLTGGQYTHMPSGMSNCVTSKQCDIASL